MKFATLITPLVLCATLAAAGKKPKLPKHGGGSSEEETTVADDQSQATETALQAQATETETRDVGEIISSFYPTQGLPTLAPSVSTILASKLISVESSWFNSPEYTSADAAINAALPLTAAPSVAISGYAYGNIMTESWFINRVPKTLQSAVHDYVSAIESVHIQYVEATATATGAQTARATTTSSRSQATSAPGSSTSSSSSGSSGAGALGAPLKVAGVVGVIGAIAVVLL